MLQVMKHIGSKLELIEPISKELHSSLSISKLKQQLALSSATKEQVKTASSPHGNP